MKRLNSLSGCSPSQSRKHQEPHTLLPGLWEQSVSVCGEDGRLEHRAQKSQGVRERVAVSRRGVLLFHVSLRNKSESASSGSSAAKAAFGGYLKRMQALKSSSLAPVLRQQQKKHHKWKEIHNWNACNRLDRLKGSPTPSGSLTPPLSPFSSLGSGLSPGAVPRQLSPSWPPYRKTAAFRVIMEGEDARKSLGWSC